MTTRAPNPRLDLERRSYRYYRNAVERHWDPHEIDLSTDRDAIAALPDAEFEGLRRTLALFGAGEEAVTEDLVPLASVLENVTDQLYVSTQLYDEAKHADYFERYWDTVVTPEERRRGLEPTSPTDERWFPAAYVELLERNERAMNRLLTADTLENRARAYCHYHLAIEGILAQTGYYSVQTEFSREAAPSMPGLVEGFSRIRADEGRHVGFGMWKLKTLVHDRGVEPTLVEETVADLADLATEVVSEATVDEDGSVAEKLAAYATRKHAERMDQILDDSTAFPSVDDLVSLERGDGRDK
ncbi:ribonucleotide-diphosphate reductase subunit beta [Halomontanus rarus]|uniref:ribonucleotide-diphosphate reductase subunit beta n=1 Tax=Halomontanus rarus TaxID=3034020 RepID=UPI001A98F0F9